MLEDERSVKFGLIPPGDEEIASETPSGDKVSLSSDDRSPSGTEGSQKKQQQRVQKEREVDLGQQEETVGQEVQVD